MPVLVLILGSGAGSGLELQQKRADEMDVMKLKLEGFVLASTA